MTSKPSTAKPSDDDWESRRNQIIGLGERSFRKSYYPELRDNIDRLSRFRALLDFSPDVILLLDLPAGNVIDANAALGQLLGTEVPQLLGRNLRSLGLAEADSLLATLEEDHCTGSAASHSRLVEIVVPGKSLRLLDLSYHIAHLDQSCFGVLIGRDAAPRLAAELEVRMLNESLEQRVRFRTRELEQINRELESFCYSVSHDLRGPLRALNGFARLIREQDGHQLSADSRMMLERIWSNADRMGELIDGLLQFSRVSRNEMTWGEVDPNRLIALIREELQRDYPHTAFDIDVLPRMFGDETMLRQALENLLSNACKFSAKHAQPRLSVSAEEQGGDTVFRIADNGAGFDMAYVGKLFGVFQRLHREADFAGTGAGLAIVKRIIERHNGRVWAEGSPGNGASFYFTLPTSL